MSRYEIDISDQLQLFDRPPSARNAWQDSHGMLRRRLRVPLTLLAIGAATAGIVGGSFATWTAQTNNPGNSVTAGTMEVGNSKSAEAVFGATNVMPGDSGSDTVTIANTGSSPMTVRLTQDQLSGSRIEASLRLRVYDRTRDRCYWPVNQPGACPDTGGVDGDGYGAWDASATLDAFTVPAASGAAQWPAGEAHTFEISWKLAMSSPNSDQGTSGSFRLVWNGTQ